MDEFLRTHPKPGKMVLIGMSMGGYLGARTAAFDERFDGLVSYDTSSMSEKRRAGCWTWRMTRSIEEPRFCVVV